MTKLVIYHNSKERSNSIKIPVIFEIHDQNEKIVFLESPCYQLPEISNFTEEKPVEVLIFWTPPHQYNNNVHFNGVRFICGPRLVIIGPSEARADLMAR